jgi:alkylation response protein AidB-like acyl-CoA dehydrogenase
MGQEPTDSYENALTQIVKERGLAGDARARQLVAEAHVTHLAQAGLVQRVTKGMRSGALPPPSGSILKLWHGTSNMRRASIGIELAGTDSVAWEEGDDGPGRHSGEFFLWRQGGALGGGSNEIQRNIISERVLNMPREFAADKDIPYRDVKRS